MIYNFKESLEKGDAIVQNHFVPYLEKKGLIWLDVGGSVADRKYGIDGVMVNLESGASKTVQVKGDNLCHKTGNLYFETTKIIDTPSKGKMVRASLLYFINPQGNKMYRMSIRELQYSWESLKNVSLGSKSVTSESNGSTWDKVGHPVPICKLKEIIPSFKEIKI